MTSLLLGVIYLAFVSLGLPDSLLGAAWPSMQPQMKVPLSWVGGISMIISGGTIISALLSDRFSLRFGAGRLTAVSVGMTAVALFGFSVAPDYWVLALIAIPYGLGAGGVDAALNNYVAIHYASRHMSWLHCMWGVGASAGPYVMGFALSGGQGWQWGYRYISIIQIVLTVIIVFSLPLWKNRDEASAVAGSDLSEGETPVDGTEAVAGAEAEPKPVKPLGVRGVLAIRGAKEILVMFFCYCAIETTSGLWASSYMVRHDGIGKVTAASLASLFYLGITAGRALSGFMTMKFDDPTMIRIGQAVLGLGIVVMLVPLPGHVATVVGLVLIGLGCAPIYPCVIHSTPAYFGVERSQAIVGVQMACAYAGSMLMPPVFGLIAQHATITLYPWYLLVLLVLMVAMHEMLRRRVGRRD
ncbi:Fucose permease [Bifidobacterium bohemicum]|uniref:Transporter, major facilitator family protein n=1 Tax=Bifidobacterium bohemicum DSM 22767 TaxID=1437606 RepID=A0A086ZG39_9BIFI|nr:MFS transporter [Bifidobacterium bohemicum]KFI45489.1 transporter, major facilitator family protein [Bifidobacterium bohemicum DSM 22767]SCB71947.1 Fucose permease [Bifidobacterium bohemicum]